MIARGLIVLWGLYGGKEGDCPERLGLRVIIRGFIISAGSVGDCPEREGKRVNFECLGSSRQRIIVTAKSLIKMITSTSANRIFQLFGVYCYI